MKVDQVLHRLLHQFLAHAICSRWPRILKGKTVSPACQPVHFARLASRCCPCSAENGALADMIAARRTACSNARAAPASAWAFSPNSEGVSLRTFNRNFEGRSGTADARVYLVSPETAVAAALNGRDSPIRATLGEMPEISMPAAFNDQRQRRARARLSR